MNKLIIGLSGWSKKFLNNKKIFYSTSAVLLLLFGYFVVYKWLVYPLFFETKEKLAVLQKAHQQLADSLKIFQNQTEQNFTDIVNGLNILNQNDSTIGQKLDSAFKRIDRHEKLIRDNNFFVAQALYSLIGLDEATSKQKANYAKYTCINILGKDLSLFKNYQKPIVEKSDCDEPIKVNIGEIPKTNISTSEPKKLKITVKPLK